MKFDNGNTASVQWGPGNYCENRDFTDASDSSTTAEIAAWNNDGDWLEFGTDTVKGWCEPDEVASFIKWVANNTINPGHSWWNKATDHELNLTMDSKERDEK